MAIKVRHEGNLTSRVVAGQGSGAAKRAMESAALIRPHQVQLTHAATAQAHAPSGGSAQLIHAPLGGGGGAPLIHAPARSGSGSGASRSSVSGGGSGAGGDYKVTGTSVFSRPDAESQWDPGSGGRWIRPWQPGEKEAEAKARVGAVEEQFQIAREDRALQGRKDLADRAIQAKKDLAEFQYTQNQRQQYAKLQGIRDTLLNSGMYSKDDIDAMMPEIEMRMKGIRDSPERMLPQDRRPVPELQISPDGKFYFDDAGGKWTPMPRERTQGPAGPTPEQSYKLRELGAAQKTYQDELRAWKKAKASYDEGVGEDPGPMPEFNEAAALERIGGRWNSVMGQSAQQPQPMPAAQTPNPQPQPQPQPQPATPAQTPNPQVIQSVGPDATPEQRAKNWAARLRKQ